MFDNIIIIILISLLGCAFWYVVQYWKYGHLTEIRGPMPVPFIGNIIMLRNRNQIIDNALKLFKQYGSVFKFWIFSDLYLLVADSELAELTLKSSKIAYKDNALYKGFNSWFGLNGLFLANGEYWRKLRTIIMQSLHYDMAKSNIQFINNQCNIVTKKLTEKIKNEEILNIDPILQALLFDIILDTAFGMNFEAQKCPHEFPYLQAANFLSPNIIKRVTSLWKRHDFLYRFSSDYKKEQDASKIINGYSKQIIDARKRIIEEDNVEFIKSSSSSKKRYRYYIDHVLQSTIDGRPFTEDEIYHFVNGLVIAAMENIHSTLNFIIYELSQNQEVQNKLVKEIEEVFGNEKIIECNVDQINRLKYMELVIKETTRYYSSLPLFVRRLQEDIEFRGMTIPKNTGLIFCTKGFHRSEKYYTDPDTYYPERFLETDKMAPYTFMGFSAGDRICPGIKVAMLEMKIVLVHLLQNFFFSSAGQRHQLKVKLCIALNSENGFHVRVKKRCL